jgi:signal recognition particle subunit SRP54
MLEGKFTLSDFQEQIKNMQKMGSMSKVMEMIPGMSSMKLPAGMMDVQEGKMKKWGHIINSMTPAERDDPELMNPGRIERVAKGSGAKPEEVRELLKQYKQLKKILKMTKGGKAFRRGPFAGLAKQMGIKF